MGLREQLIEVRRVVREASEAWDRALWAYGQGEYEPLRQLVWHLPVVRWFRDRERYE
jgi:hypothetical protein